MTHFHIGQWVDFSRGLDAAIDRPSMESHLASGCERCRRVVDVLSGISRIARGERDVEPPETALRLARAIYQRQPPQTLVGRLIFDSFREPLAAGLRSQDRETRHALWEAGAYCVDVRLDHQRAADTLTLVGQIVDRDHPGATMADVHVVLKNAEKMIAAAPCNPFGEFQLECRPAAALRLDVSLGATGRHLELPLKGLLDVPAGRRRGKRKARISVPKTPTPE